MTRQEAIEEMRKGKKITHEYFSNGEFIYMDGGRLFNESDLCLPFTKFWETRSDWPDEGWSVVEET